MKHLITLAFALILTACGGGGGDAPSPAPTCTPVQQVRIQLFGDSTQAGYDGSNNQIGPNNPTSALQAELDLRYGRGVTFVISSAMGGTTSQELLAGTDGKNPPWPKSVTSNIVVINHGINDATHYGGARFSEYGKTLETLVNLLPPDVTLIFETPNIVKGWDLVPYAQELRNVAARHGLRIADTYAYTSSLPDWNTLIPDWAHPSDALYAMIVKNSLAPVVIAETDKLLCKRPRPKLSN